jgi:hypothetical protein
MEHGTVTSVYYDDGVVYCDVSPVRTTEPYSEVPVLKSHSGFVKVPEQRDTVTMDTLADGKKFITGVVKRNTENPGDMKEGELAIQLDGNTTLAFKQKKNGDHDVHIGSSGDVIINGVPFKEHTHQHDDATIEDTAGGSGSESTAEKQTTQPTEFTNG